MKLTRRLGRIVSIIFLVMGIILLLHPQISLTGATIGTPRATLSWLSGLGLLVIVVSILLLLSLSREERRSKLEEELTRATDAREKIRRIEKAYTQGILNPVEAAYKINECVPLGGMDYKKEVKLTLESTTTPPERYSLQSKTDDDLAYALRAQIRANSTTYEKNIKMHISKTESTKHHRRGLRK